MATMAKLPANDAIRNTAVSQEMLQLIEQLSVEEKVSLLAGRDFSSTAAISRLKLPSLKVSCHRSLRLEPSWVKDS
jgi:hypothetical protein